MPSSISFPTKWYMSISDNKMCYSSPVLGIIGNCFISQWFLLWLLKYKYCIYSPLNFYSRLQMNNGTWWSHLSEKPKAPKSATMQTEFNMTHHTRLLCQFKDGRTCGTFWWFIVDLIFKIISLKSKSKNL